MNNRMCEMFGIDVPIFAFSHCRDVVAEVSKAGGLGVIGMARMSPRRVKEELQWIDDHIGGKPYGIDVLMPVTYEDSGKLKFELDKLLPKEHVEFVRDMLDKAGVPRLPEGEEQRLMQEIVEAHNFTPKESLEMIEVAMEHPIKLIVNALGSPPKSLVERAHALGIKLAALAGKIKEERLNRMIFIGQASLRRAVSDFIEHYHTERNHQGLGNRLIRGHPTAVDNNGIVQRRQRLGGMLNFYYRKAA